MNFENEIFRMPPIGTLKRDYKGGEPILYAWGCALLERETASGFVYTAVNLTTDKTEVLSRRVNPLSPQYVNKMAERMRKSKVAGAGRFEIDRPPGEQIEMGKAYEILNYIFKTVLPKYGYTIRKEQIDLAVHILTAIRTRKLSLSEAEVGTGKTHAYLIAAIIVKRGRLNDFWNKGYYPKMDYADMPYMPIVIATSSIALQKAIITEYIPELSQILLENGIIKTPLTAVLRKGKGHYVCEKNLRAHLTFENNKIVHQILKGLLSPNASIDLAEIDDPNRTYRLTPYVKRKICVPKKCFDFCKHREECRYLDFREEVQSAEIDIQVCNHNYLIADTLRIASDIPPLIPNYQTVIIDEAHKLISAVRSMYGTEFSSQSLPELLETVDMLNFKNTSAQNTAHRDAKKLADQSNRFFEEMFARLGDDLDDEAERFTAEMDFVAVRHLRNIRDISDRLLEFMSAEQLVGYGAERKSQILSDLEQYRDQAAALVKHTNLICWLEISKDVTRLCAIPKDIDERMFADQWHKPNPTILTSGTLSTNADFSHIKRSLGLERLKDRLTEISKPSPFNYKENAMLYISENVPFPDQNSREYVAAVANEVERLIIASHGHAAVLFTSYKAMDMVWELLENRKIPFPLLRLDKGGVTEIERFKRSGNGVLFASGALWEGIDIPGDALSMLIIVKLPFAVPDPISEYEQTLYSSMNEYKNRVIIPEMLIKLKQGFGRLIRKETDTGVVAILDSRANSTGAYRNWVLNALPECRVTRYIAYVQKFIQGKKTPNYFI